MEEVKKLEAELKGTSGDERLKILISLIKACSSFSSEKTTKYCQEALDIQENCSSTKDRINVFRMAARVNIENGDNDNAWKNIITAKEMAEEYGDFDQTLLVGLIQCEFLLRKSEYKETVDVLSEFSSQVEQAENQDNVRLLLNHLGIAYDGLGNYDYALESYFKVLDQIGVQEKNNLHCSTHINIGNTYTNCQELDKAFNHYNEALVIAEDLQDDGLKCNCMLNIAGIFYHKEEFEKALDCYEEIKQIYEKRGFMADLQSVFCNIGRTQAMLGKPELAIKYYENALEISKQLDNKYLTANTSRFLAELYIEQKKYDLGEELLSEALQIAMDIKSQNLVRAIYFSFTDYYKTTRKYKRALECTDELHKLTFQIFNKESQTRLEKLSVKYETDKKEREAEIYRLKNIELVETNRKLREALDQVKVLGGLIPICANCKKIRDDKGFWNQLEAYITEHSDAAFTHGICPSCVEDMYMKLDKM